MAFGIIIPALSTGTRALFPQQGLKGDTTAFSQCQPASHTRPGFNPTLDNRASRRVRLCRSVLERTNEPQQGGRSDQCLGLGLGLGMLWLDRGGDKAGKATQRNTTQRNALYRLDRHVRPTRTHALFSRIGGEGTGWGDKGEEGHQRASERDSVD